MRKRAAVWVLGLASAYALPAATETPTDSGYRQPPKVIVDLLDAPTTPTVTVSPDRRLLALLERRAMPTVADLARPILRLAGQRIDPRSNGPQERAGAAFAITIRTIADGSDRKVRVPASPHLGNLSFSPDGRRLAFTQTRPDGVDLYVAETGTGQARLLATSLNATRGDPCDWFEDGQALLCRFVPAGRGAPPAAPEVPAGPNILETAGKPAPAPTFEDLLRNAHDEALFEHYFASQLARVDANSGRRSPIGAPAIFDSVRLSPDDAYILVAKVKRPYSRLLPMNGFPKDVELWTRRGELARRIADVPSAEGVPINGVLTGPRGWRWRLDQPATLLWAEAQDGGDIRNQVPFRDKVFALAAPFAGAPVEVAKTEYRYGGLAYTEQGIGLLGESDRATRRTRTWLLEPGREPRKLWDRRQQDRYADPGTPLTRRSTGGGGGFGGFGGFGADSGPILQAGDAIYLNGLGASPEGDRPFLDRLNLGTLATERLFRSEPGTYESPVVLLSDDGTSLLTRFETPAEPPNYLVRALPAGPRRVLTAFPDPQPQLRGIERQLVTYERKDGVRLSATLYLPPGYQKGQRLPVVMWAYPREFTDTDSASQISGSPHRFSTFRGASHMLLLTQGYAIFDNPTMPIVGPGETANDNYVEQLVASAEAAVDKVVEMGVGDRDRIGVGGHSYGAFMTANLLAYTDLFRAGIARSGAYNRTLTPFGFQAETRTFWQVPQVYARMSPFHNADKINEPILLVHGEADDNSGTFPIQSERLYMALKGLGGTVRYVTLPHEAHGYAGRESNLHVVAEMVDWMDKYVKNAAPRAAATKAERR